LKVTYTEEAVADVVDAITYINERSHAAAANLDAEDPFTLSQRGIVESPGGQTDLAPRRTDKCRNEDGTAWARVPGAPNIPQHLAGLNDVAGFNRCEPIEMGVLVRLETGAEDEHHIAAQAVGPNARDEAVRRAPNRRSARGEDVDPLVAPPERGCSSRVPDGSATGGGKWSGGSDNVRLTSSRVRSNAGGLS
jgi:hypothetical protein